MIVFMWWVQLDTWPSLLLCVINRSKCIVSSDWSIFDDRMFSSSRPIQWQYTFAPMYVRNTTKDGRAPITRIQSDFTEKK